MMNKLLWIPVAAGLPVLGVAAVVYYQQHPSHDASITAPQQVTQDAALRQPSVQAPIQPSSQPTRPGKEPVWFDLDDSQSRGSVDWMIEADHLALKGSGDASAPVYAGDFSSSYYASPTPRPQSAWLRPQDIKRRQQPPASAESTEPSSQTQDPDEAKAASNPGNSLFPPFHLWDLFGRAHPQPSTDADAGSEPTVQLSVSRNPAAPGEKVTIAWTVTPAARAHPMDWIGFFANATVPVELALSRYPTGGQPSGRVTQQVPVWLLPGTYHLRYLSGLTGRQLASKHLTVAPRQSHDEEPTGDTDDDVEGTYSLSVTVLNPVDPGDPTKAALGDDVRISWSVSPTSLASANDLIQLCLVDVEVLQRVPAVDQLCVPFVLREGQASGTVDVSVSHDFDPGDYVLQYVVMTAGGVVKEVPLRLVRADRDDKDSEDNLHEDPDDEPDDGTAAYTLGVRPSRVTPGESVAIHWRVRPPALVADEDAIKLCAVEVPGLAGTCVLVLSLEEDAASGEEDYDVPTLTPVGSYELRYLLADSGQIAKTASLTVVEGHRPSLDRIGNRIVQVGATVTVVVSAEDADDESESLAFRVSRRPSGATFDDQTRTFSWTPTAGQAGEHDVTFTVTDRTELEDSETITITVFDDEEPAPTPTLSFSANPTLITVAGRSSRLTWSSTHAEHCTASGGWSGEKSTSGLESVRPLETTSYTLTCTGPGGSVTRTLTVNVQIGTPTSSYTLSVEPNLVEQGHEFTITWTVVPAGQASEDDWIGFYVPGMPDTMPPLGNQQFPTGGTASGSLTRQVPPGASPGRYELRYVSELGGDLLVRARVSLTVIEEQDEVPAPAPTLSFSADPLVIVAGQGQTSLLSWTSSHAQSCSASGGWSGQKPTSGGESVSPTGTTSYTLTCEGPGGTTSQTVTITVEPPPPVKPDAELVAYQHLAERMDVSFSDQSPRLIESYMEPYPPNFGVPHRPIALVADNAAAVMALLARGNAEDLRRAKLICDALVWYQQHDPSGDGRLRQAYKANQHLPTATEPAIHDLGYSASTRELAWAALAWLSYFEHDPQAVYRQAAIEAAEFLIQKLSDASGQPGLYRGFRVELIEADPTAFTLHANPNPVPLGAALSIYWEAPPAEATPDDVIELVIQFAGSEFPYPEIIHTGGTRRGTGSIQIPASSPLPGVSQVTAQVRYHRSGITGLVVAQTPVTIGGALQEHLPPAPELVRHDVLVTEKVTEDNLAAYVLFMRLYDLTGESRWRTAAEDARRFIDSVAWDHTGGKFWVGTLADQALDQVHLVEPPQALALLALGNVRRYGRALEWTDNTLELSADGFSGFDAGFDAGNSAGSTPDGVWFEGTAQMALAYQVAGRVGQADFSDYYRNELERAQDTAQGTNRKGLVAASHNGVTSGFANLAYYASPHIGTTAWYLLAKRRVNALWATSTNDPVPHDVTAGPLQLRILKPDLNEDGQVTQADVDLVVNAYGHGEEQDGVNWPLYEPYDLDGNSAVRISDVLLAAQAVGLSWPLSGVQEGRQLSLYVKGVSQDASQQLTYSASQLPSGACFNGLLATGQPGTCQARQFLWTPDVTQAGSYQITLTVRAGNTESSEILTISVRDNSPPVLTPIGYKSVLVSGKLTFPVEGSDPDNDPLVFRAYTLPTGAAFAQQTGNPNAWQFTWIPGQQALGTHEVTFQVYDGAVSDAEKVTITVKATNQPPSLTLDPSSPQVLVLGSGKLLLTVSASDPDDPPEALDTPAYTDSTNALEPIPQGLLKPGSTPAAWVLSWVPEEAHLGRHSVTLTVKDPIGASSSKTLEVAVQRPNDSPVLDPIGNKSVVVSGKLTFTVYASDPAGERVTLKAQLATGEVIDSTGANSLGAKFTDNGSGSGDFSWTTSAAQIGIHRVTFTATDVVGLTDSETITITVQPSG